MVERPSLRAVVFWERRPVYLAIAFSLMVFLLIFLDSGSLYMWKGLISGNPGLSRLALFVVWGLAMLPGIAWGILRWTTTTHELRETQFMFSRGVFNKKHYMVKYEQVQNINMDRSFVERLLGISTVRVETAGAKPGESELELEGLSLGYAEKLVKELSRMADVAKGKETAKVQVNVGTLKEKGEGELSELRAEVKRLADELEEIRGILSSEKRKKSP